MSGKRFGMMGALLASAAVLGPMTAAERAKGRYMRAPDHDAEFREFEESGDVEVGESDKSTPAAEADKPKPRRRAQPKPAPAIEETKDGEPAGDDDDDDAGEGEGGEEGGEEGEDKTKPRRKASDRIRDLTRQLREEQRSRTTLEGRLSALEKGGLPANREGGNGPDIGEKPDPTDTAKYPLGHLDERYVEDSMDWRLRKHAAETADASLQRQEQAGRDAAQREQQERLLGQVDDISAKGSELYDDFEDAVVKTGLAGEWRLDQPTFEAAAEADHGAQILYELSQDKKEAARVAGLSPYQQLRFVDKRNAEIAEAAKPRNKPAATPPPRTATRGANSRRQIPADTDDLGEFEKAWEADAKG